MKPFNRDPTQKIFDIQVPRDEHTLNTLGDKMIVTGGYGDLK